MKIDDIINQQRIEEIINRVVFDEKKFLDIIEKSKEKKGLSLEDVAIFITAPQEMSDYLFKTSSWIRREIYGNRTVLFAPLYVSSYCVNRCAYCGFQAQNHQPRMKLDSVRIRLETEALLDMGHKRALLECGEDPSHNSLDYVLSAIRQIYGTKNSKGDSIRRVNVNIAAGSVEDYRRLAEVGIGTYNLFQETYHQPTYEKVHPQNTPKGNYERQLFAMNRAIEGGLGDLGMGVLYGLYDWRFELLALISHAQYLDRTFGIGPHAISFPRIQQAGGVEFMPPFPVSDDDFLKIIAIIRMAIPYAGMVISTRENPEIRLKAFRIGISQTSAGSSTVPGGYACPNKGKKMLKQFELHDNRSLDEISYELLVKGFIPSHCTACEFQGRMGKNFMPFAKSGNIKNFCQPNALITLKEYLLNYASIATNRLGQEIIEWELSLLPALRRSTTEEWLRRLDRGEKKYFYT
ncbi:MAG: [FeFe] hydrogenase H-cluster radical SAM maturase HydG [Parcubacteria group bacterium GW2011_GWA2_38_13b]|nr:MAG: [FeFe] hydrogenase H-cluster radical SAM maturase HydG [Parcubacteria group bacterium GW2011_GWA2_38_13b]